MEHIDYLAVGHVTEDVWRDGSITPGGTVMYSSRAAKAFTPNVMVLTAANAKFNLFEAFGGIAVQRVDAPTTTQFENIYEMMQLPDGGSRSTRRQVVRPCNVILNNTHVTREMRHSQIVHLAPVCNEINVNILSAFDADTFVGLTPQGWLRRWDALGRVTQRPSNWSDADAFLRRANAVVMSIDDVEGDWDAPRAWARKTRLLVVTQGPLGCTVFVSGVPTDVAAPRVQEVDPTGAGDIFAATLYMALRNGKDPICAAEYANCIAAQSVMRPKLAGIPTPHDIETCDYCS
jgi:hypothetical protein